MLPTIACKVDFFLATCDNFNYNLFANCSVCSKEKRKGESICVQIMSRDARNREHFAYYPQFHSFTYSYSLEFSSLPAKSIWLTNSR